MKNKKNPFLSNHKVMASTVIVTAISFIVIVSMIFAVLFYKIRQNVKAEFLVKGQEYGHIIDKKISDAMNYLTLVVNMLETQIENQTADREQLQVSLFNIFDSYGLIDGTSIMFEKNMYDGKDSEYKGSEYGTATSGRICWYYYLDNGKPAYLPEVSENEIEFEEPHYVNAKEAGTPIYGNPFVYEVDGVDIPMITLSYPMYDKNGVFLGVVTVDVFLLDLYSRLQSEKIYETGYMVVTNDKGNIVYSPVYDDIGMSREEVGVSYALPLTNELVAYSDTSSHINGKKIFSATVSIDIPQLDNNFYVTVAAPVNEIYADGFLLMCALAVFCFIILLLMLFFLIKRIVEPIKLITENAYKMARGELNEADAFYLTNENIKSRNELYLLYLALKRTVAELGEIRRIKLDAIEMRFEKEKAEEASRTKSAFLANMSHEIRTPMNAITGMAELILRENIQPVVREHALSIKLAGANLLAIINDILDFSKIESGKLEILPVRYEFASLINDVISIIRMRVVEKSILFTVNIDCNLPAHLIGDEIRIRQILLNLLSNAYKYCEEGYISMTIVGEITGEDAAMLIIEIADSGSGIKEEDINKLFGDFVQIDMEKNKGIEGTGLGLAITKKLCVAMGGDISVQSVYGTGSTFTVTLPQKFDNYEKFASVENSTEKNVLIYETRPVYSSSIVCSIDNLDVNCSLVTNQSNFYEELKKHSYQYVFVSSFLLNSAKRIMANLNVQPTLVLLTEFGDTIAASNTRMLSMPAHSISIANILNDVADNINYNESEENIARFTAPSASVLIVDDISTNLKIAEGLMLPYKMRIDVCVSGMEAIEMVQAKRYDIIFMDHMMPEMDGIEATLKIRGLGGDYYENVPVIALTANAISGVKEMFLNNGFSDFLAKPIETLKLNEILENWISKEKQEKYTATKREVAVPPFEIEGIDVKKGISLTGGSSEGYLETLVVFYKDGVEKTGELSAYLKKGNLNNYTIYVHALKSALASIGAAGLSERAMSLELAGKNEDITFIRENNPSFLEELEALLERISHVISTVEKPNVPEASADIGYLKTEAASLIEALDDMNLDRAERIMNNLRGRNWDKSISDTLDDIAQNILLCEYDGALALIDTLNKKNEPHTGSFTDTLRSVHELSVDRALSALGGSGEVYERSVRITAGILPENIEKLNELIKTDLSLYMIEVHGVKGVLNSIGAFKLGEKAYELEILSNDGKRNDCEALHTVFIKELTKFSEEIKALLVEL